MSTTSTAISLRPVAAARVTYIERGASVIGCIVHGRDTHTVYRGAEEVFAHDDPVTVRRFVRRFFAA